MARATCLVVYVSSVSVSSKILAVEAGTFIQLARLPFQPMLFGPAPSPLVLLKLFFKNKYA